MKTTLLLLASSISFFAMAEPHTWTLQNGDKFSGEYYSSGQEKVVVTIKVSDLSETDKKYVTEQKTAQVQKAKQEAYKIRPVRIVSILDSFGQCEVTGISPVSTKIIMYDIPEPVKDYLADYYQLINDSTDGKFTEQQLVVIKAESESNVKFNSESSASAAAIGVGDNAVGLGSGSTVGTGTAINTGNAVKRIYNARLPEVKAHLAENTTVLAYPLGYSHDGFNVWQCVGVVSP